jgi:hypothetical protein
VKERPILFSGPMVRAILAGQKTVTRRVCAVQPVEVDGLWNAFYPWGEGGHGIYETEAEMREEFDRLMMAHNPYGAVGDRLWVRETWRTFERKSDSVAGILFRADDAFVEIENTREAAERWVDAHENGKHGNAWRPSIFMRPWMCRIRLEITAIRIDRLQCITEEQAKAEGAPDQKLVSMYLGIRPRSVQGVASCTHREGFEWLWDTINGKRRGCAWKDNPWVIAVTFKPVEASNA